MARLNAAVKSNPIYTAEGAVAKRINPEQQLRRLVMSCMLWEDNFYCDGKLVADLIADTIPKINPVKVAEIAVDARSKMKLRHIPLLLCREMLMHEKHRPLVADTLAEVIQRPDELSEFLAIYWKDGRCPVAAQAKKGLAKAFGKFNEYSLAKYNRDDGIKLRDVLFIAHPKPKDAEQDALWKRLINGELAVPDTWEVSLSAGKGENKKEAWERLLRENKLGALALLRNLRNFRQENVDENMIFNALKEIKTERVLPFRFIAAARHAPQWEDKIEPAMLKCLEGQEKLTGKTALLLDVSGSMDDAISSKSDLRRIDAACAVGILLRELAETIGVFTFSEKLIQVPPRRGFALRDAIVNSQEHRCTYLGRAINQLYDKFPGMDRLIVITDEQSHDRIPDPRGRAYMINVASNRNGVGYGPWHHIDGWSEAVIDYIREYEKVDN